MENKITICKAEFNDLEDILLLQKKAYLTEAAIYNDYTIPPLHQTIESIQNEFNESYILKATTIDNKLIGSIRVVIKGTNGYIGKLIVDEQFQNMGIGKKLLYEIEKIHSEKVTRLELFTGIKSEKNLHIYLHFGYKEFKREKLNENVTIVFLEKYIH